MNHRTLLVTIFGASIVGGCSAPAEVGFGGTSDPGPSALALQLETPRRFDVATAGGTSTIRVVVEGQWAGGERKSIDLPVIDGSVTLAADENADLVLQQLSVGFEDVAISAENFPPYGAELTDLVISLAAPVPSSPSWTDTEAVAASSLDLLLDWSVMLHDGPAPLATQQLEDLPFEITVRDDGEALAIELSMASDGDLWAFGEFLQLKGVFVDLKGIAAP